MEKIERETHTEIKLDNGFTFNYKNVKTSEITEACLIVNCGGYHERGDQEGYAHFLEHCLSTGGSLDLSMQEFDAIRSNLGMVNASTNLGRTRYIGSMLNEDSESWLKMISSTIFRPRFEISKVEMERKRVLREIADRDSNHLYPKMIEARKALYGNHPMMKNILGNHEIIEKTTADELREFHSFGYHPNNMTLIMAGNLPDNIEDRVNLYFGQEKAGRSTFTKFPRAENLKEKVIIQHKAEELLNKNSPQESTAYVSLHYILSPQSFRDTTLLDFMESITGKGLESILFRKLSIENGLSYSTSSDFSDLFGAGSFTLEAPIKANKIEEGINLMFETLEDLKNSKINREQIKNWNKRIRYSLINSRTPLANIQFFIDNNRYIEEKIKIFQSITIEDIKEVANKYFEGNRETGKYLLFIRNPLL